MFAAGALSPEERDALLVRLSACWSLQRARDLKTVLACVRPSPARGYGYEPDVLGDTEVAAVRRCEC